MVSEAKALVKLPRRRQCDHPGVSSDFNQPYWDRQIRDLTIVDAVVLWSGSIAKKMTARNFDRAPPFWNKQSSELPFPPPSPRADMAELHDNLAGLRGLYQDLSAITDSPFPSIERLCFELETHIHDFRKLLDKPPKANDSRQKVLSGSYLSRLL